jgi:hypothetical protein
MRSTTGSDQVISGFLGSDRLRPRTRKYQRPGLTGSTAAVAGVVNAVLASFRHGLRVRLYCTSYSCAP